MIFLVKSSNGSRALKIHQATANHAPLCGGGYCGKQIKCWQEDIGPANCKLCEYQLKRKAKPSIITKT
jgi:hypothetical protein